MASLVLSGDTSGSVTLSAPAVAGSNTQTLVATTGTLAPIVSGTAVTASGTTVDFTSLPSWVKRITVLLDGVSTNGTSNILCRIGTGGTVTATGYSGNTTTLTNAAAVAVTDATTSLVVAATTSAANICVSTVVWSKLSGNTWVGTSSGRTAATVATIGNVSVTLSGALDILRILTGNGTDTFDAGTINILYE
jgi:hypothetical protein